MSGGASLAAGVVASGPDTDGDFFEDDEENRIGTDPLVACEDGVGLEDWPVDVWPYGAPDTVVDTVDVALMMGFVGTEGGGRYNIVKDTGDDKIDASEVVMVLGFVGMACPGP